MQFQTRIAENCFERDPWLRSIAFKEIHGLGQAITYCLNKPVLKKSVILSLIKL
jgi:hypothetical protein